MLFASFSWRAFFYKMQCDIFFVVQACNLIGTAITFPYLIPKITILHIWYCAQQFTRRFFPSHFNYLFWPWFRLSNQLCYRISNVSSFKYEFCAINSLSAKHQCNRQRWLHASLSSNIIGSNFPQFLIFHLN